MTQMDGLIFKNSCGQYKERLLHNFVQVIYLITCYQALFDSFYLRRKKKTTTTTFSLFWRVTLSGQFDFGPLHAVPLTLRVFF